MAKPTGVISATYPQSAIALIASSVATYKEVEQPGTSSREASDRNPRAQRRDLTCVEECQAKESSREEKTEKKDESPGSRDRRFVLRLTGRAGHYRHACAHAEGRDHHELPPTEAVDSQYSNRRAQRLEREDTGTQYPGEDVRKTKILMEDGRHVECQGVDTALRAPSASALNHKGLH